MGTAGSVGTGDAGGDSTTLDSVAGPDVPELSEDSGVLEDSVVAADSVVSADSGAVARGSDVAAALDRPVVVRAAAVAAPESAASAAVAEGVWAATSEALCGWS